MSNPMLEMLSKATGANNGNFSGGGFPAAKFFEFMKMMQGRNPEQILQNYIKQNNISEAEYKQVLEMAKGICGSLGIR